MKHCFDFPLWVHVALMTQVDANTNELHPASSWTFVMVIPRKTFQLWFSCWLCKNKEFNIFAKRAAVHVSSLGLTISHGLTVPVVKVVQLVVSVLQKIHTWSSYHVSRPTLTQCRINLYSPIWRCPSRHVAVVIPAYLSFCNKTQC